MILRAFFVVMLSACCSGAQEIPFGVFLQQQHAHMETSSNGPSLRGVLANELSMSTGSLEGGPRTHGLCSLLLPLMTMDKDTAPADPRNREFFAISAAGDRWGSAKPEAAIGW
jgi:hypothetical protein